MYNFNFNFIRNIFKTLFFLENIGDTSLHSYCIKLQSSAKELKEKERERERAREIEEIVKT